MQPHSANSFGETHEALHDAWGLLDCVPHQPAVARLPFEPHVLARDELEAPAYLAINPPGAVPALVEGDFVLTRNAAILGCVADVAPQSGLACDGTLRQRAEANRWLAFVNGDLHPALHPLFWPARFHAGEAQHEAIKATARSRVRGLHEQERHSTDATGSQAFAATPIRTST